MNAICKEIEDLGPKYDADIVCRQHKKQFQASTFPESFPLPVIDFIDRKYYIVDQDHFSVKFIKK